MHLLPSSHLVAGPAVHLPVWHRSPLLHGSPSSQVLADSPVCEQPLPGMQPSAVHALPSLQGSLGPPTHWPSWHASPKVHTLPSLHGSLLGVCRQPRPSWQASLVHACPSSHRLGLPGLHTPAAHASPLVQGSPSSHSAPLFLCVQPVSGAQPSSVQGLLSPQLGPPLPAHLPAVQVSPWVQPLPSSQAVALTAKFTHPLAGSHESIVQGFLSLQGSTLPPQTPWLHESL